MKVIRGLPLPQNKTPCALTIGNYDGVHKGHQVLLERLIATAKEHHLQSCVLTFEPHPKEFFDPQNAPARILNLRDKLVALERFGVDCVYVEHFNAAFAKKTPEVFVQEILVNGLDAKKIIIGDDFHYGSRRAGNINTLESAGKNFNFEVTSIPTVLDNRQQRISSSALRQALKEGQMDLATTLLGRPYSISGHVLHGRKLGRTLGFPTLNLMVSNQLHQRPHALSGIFVALVHGLEAKPLPAVASLGVRPTVEDAGNVLLETHVFDFKKEVYGKLVRVELVKKLRDEKKYSSLDELTQAIQHDAQLAREYFKN
ncbi:MAG: bifunctional riboflavin kinase/FAD synthetase [Betaproteobacteria bacterium]